MEETGEELVRPDEFHVIADFVGMSDEERHLAAEQYTSSTYTHLQRIIATDTSLH